MAPETADKTVRYLSSIDIEQRAREIRKEYDLETIPVNPLDLAQKLGIDVRNARFDKESMVGMIFKDESGVAIWIKKTDPPLRKRFTIAHELGHYFLHLEDHPQYVDDEVNLYRQQSPDGGEKTETARREIQANMFAAAFLMPERQVRQFWADTRSLREMARIFIVSRQAMGYRIAQLGLE